MPGSMRWWPSEKNKEGFLQDKLNLALAGSQLPWTATCDSLQGKTLLQKNSPNSTFSVLAFSPYLYTILSMGYLNCSSRVVLFQLLSKGLQFTHKSIYFLFLHSPVIFWKGFFYRIAVILLSVVLNCTQQYLSLILVD